MRTVPDTLTHERVAVFIDHGETQAALQQAGRRVDLLGLRDYLAEGRHVVETFLYIAGDRNDGRQADPVLDRLPEHGFLVRPGPTLAPARSGRFTLDLALDAQEFAARVRPDIVVIASGDGALAALAQRLRLQGIRVEVASTPAHVAPELRGLANGFVDLTELGRPVDHLALPGEDLDFDPALAAAPHFNRAGFGDEEQPLAPAQPLPLRGPAVQAPLP